MAVRTNAFASQIGATRPEASVSLMPNIEVSATRTANPASVEAGGIRAPGAARPASPTPPGEALR